MFTTAGTIGPLYESAPGSRVITVGDAARVAVAVPRTGIPRTTRLVLHHCHRQGGFPVKRRSGLGVVIGGLAAIALAGATLAFSGLTNSSFETGTYVDGGAGFEQLNAGDTSLDGWTVDAGSVDWIGTYWPAQNPSMSIDMSGTDAGTISQTLATTIGNTYTVSFFLSGNPAGPPTVKTLDVSATGGTVGNYSYDVTSNTLTSMNWTPATYTFLATSASTTLSFISTTTGAFGPAIDNVAVTETVPTKSDCKQGGWQTMIDGVGNHFKNQGDCVSYFATGGKNLGALPPATAANADATNVDATTDSDTTRVQVKHSTKGHDQATGRHATVRPDAKDKTRSHAGHRDGPRSHRSK
jgi:choice-of-anchor C domain-containing protein